MPQEHNKQELRIILKGIKKGSEFHFKRAFDLYQSKIFHTCRKMQISNEECEEIVQETFLSIWQQRHKLDADSSLPGLLFTIAKRLVIKLIREKIQQRKYCESVDIKSQLSLNQTEEYVIFTDLQQHAQQGINQLPPKRKQIYMLSKQLGLSNDEIATKLRVSKRTVENQLYRAAQHLRQYLESEKLLFWLLMLIGIN